MARHKDHISYSQGQDTADGKKTWHVHAQYEGDHQSEGAEPRQEPMQRDGEDRPITRSWNQPLYSTEWGLSGLSQFSSEDEEL
jgi:hypothetical protein